MRTAWEAFQGSLSFWGLVRSTVRVPEAGLGRRRGVLAVSTSPLPEGNWRAAVLLGVDRVVTLPGDDELLVTALADATEPPATRAAPVSVAREIIRSGLSSAA